MASGCAMRSWAFGGISAQKGWFDSGMDCTGRLWNHRPWRPLWEGWIWHSVPWSRWQGGVRSPVEINLRHLSQPYCFCDWHLCRGLRHSWSDTWGLSDFGCVRGRNSEYLGSGTKLNTLPVLTKVVVAEIRLLWRPVAAQSALPSCKLLLLR